MQEEHLKFGAQHIPLMDEEHLETDTSTDKVCFSDISSCPSPLSAVFAWPHELDTPADHLGLYRTADLHTWLLKRSPGSWGRPGIECSAGQSLAYTVLCNVSHASLAPSSAKKLAHAAGAHL